MPSFYWLLGNDGHMTQCYYWFFMTGLMCELLWSDPQPQLGRGPSKRGVALSFGADVTKKFLQENNLGKYRGILFTEGEFTREMLSPFVFLMSCQILLSGPMK